MRDVMGSSFKITGELHRSKALLNFNCQYSLTSQQVWRNIHIDTQALYFAATGKRV
jgi:hypothetical protein